MRAFLGGRAVPRDEFAIIGIGESTGVPVVLLLEDGEVFTPEDYLSLGYTNFETWCVGASGGRGGDATDTVKWLVSHTTEVMPSDIWADYLDQVDSINGPYYVYYGTSPPGTPEPPQGVRSWVVGAGGWITWQLYPQGVAELQNPTHTAVINHWLEPIVQPGGKYIGGGGGGGGLHVVSGLLADLPTSLVVEVGQHGADGAPGQSKQAAVLDPSPIWSLAQYPLHTINHARWDFLNRFPNGHPTVGGPSEGSPGGTSSFGDICQASGGKGGKPAIQWAGSTRQQYAHGGQGGIGGSEVAGGGADGATTNTSPGKDGSWNGIVGAGGGGGRGGVRGNSAGDASGQPIPAASDILATEGGRGSLNFADTSVWGPRGPRGTYFMAILNYVKAITQNPSADVYLGALISTDEILISPNVNPGSGGGARIPGNRKYGGRATGYNHDGAVLVRLTKID